MTEERRDSDDMPEHERRPETGVGAGLSGTAGTTGEAPRDTSAEATTPIDAIRDPAAGLTDEDADEDEDEEPVEPDGPDVAIPPKSI